jgi:hypothetical protein
MSRELRESIRRNAFSLALWDGCSDIDADYKAELAVFEAEKKINAASPSACRARIISRGETIEPKMAAAPK